ncbi:c-type heme family protein [Novipirellula sp. SH528]|uniref:c-type heme family protein n=1 Tax=Novipirellula sp. SH528 TaxID=3454466 RepID=UPI003F9EF9D5
MTRLNQNNLLMLPLVVAMFMMAMFVMGCKDRGEQNAPTKGATSAGQTELPDVERSDDKSTPSPDKRRAVAAKAKDALFTRLSARLMEVMQSEGPAAAINVCSNEAIAIAEAVGKEHGVEIGRTSFKLRNRANAPRDWVKPFVEERVDTPQYTPLGNDSLGAVFPIHMSVKCLMCHGGENDVLDVVKLELAKRYPDDEATGFKLDDLRGWFWVEVPSDAT